MSSMVQSIGAMVCCVYTTMWENPTREKVENKKKEEIKGKEGKCSIVAQYGLQFSSSVSQGLNQGV